MPRPQPMVTRTVRMPDMMWQTLEKIADKQNLTVSEVLRDAANAVIIGDLMGRYPHAGRRP